MEYCLFEGRHEIPNNPPSIFKSFDFNKFEGIYNLETYKKLVSHFIKGESIKVYVTGLTPALIELLKLRDSISVQGNITLLHFDRESNSYKEQVI